MPHLAAGAFRPPRLAAAERHLLLMLVAFAATVIATRWFLAWSGYPKVGGGDLHIAHALWGGGLLFVASLLPLVWSGRAVHELAALSSGAGMGLFIDEVGKFITTANDYFYPAAAPIIYATFLTSALLYVWVRQVTAAGIVETDGASGRAIGDGPAGSAAAWVRDRVTGRGARTLTILALFAAGLVAFVTAVLIGLAVAFVIPSSDLPLLLQILLHVAIEGIAGSLLLVGAVALVRGRHRVGVAVASAGLVISLCLGDLVAFYLRQFDSIGVVLFHLVLLIAVRTLSFGRLSGRTRR